MTRSAARGADVVVIGAGLVGLAIAADVAERGSSVILLADVRPGEASPAAAGMLAPSVERSAGPAHAFALAARDRFPEYLAWLAAQSGIEVPLNRLGIIELALDEAGAAALRAVVSAPSRWLERAELAALEPALSHGVGAIFHPLDGAVNNLVLMRALKSVLGRHEGVRIELDAAVAIDLGAGRATIETRAGKHLSGEQVVLAAGVWSGGIAGLPRALPIEPVRGQMLSLAASPLRHVVYGGGGYAVPRGDGRTYVGSTMERVDFDARTTPEGVARIREIAGAIAPPLGEARILNGWAGLRPVTPDFLPILGRDPGFPALVYACGHSRNGILLAPLTGDAIGALIAGERPPADLSPFGIERFGTSATDV